MHYPVKRKDRGSIAELIADGCNHGATSWGLDEVWDALFGSSDTSETRRRRL